MNWLMSIWSASMPWRVNQRAMLALGDRVDGARALRDRLHEPLPHQLPQATGEDPWSDPGADPQLLEALGTEQEVAHQHQPPTISDRVQGTGYGVVDLSRAGNPTTLGSERGEAAAGARRALRIHRGSIYQKSFSYSIDT